jgi:arginyl-tRNA synthetase
VRIKSILEKYAQSGKDASAYGGHVNSSQTPAEKALLIELVKFNATIAAAYDELAPHKICAYIYDLSNAFNKFYHENNIMGEEDAKKQAGLINLLKLTQKTLETSIDILGFSAPERM